MDIINFGDILNTEKTASPDAVLPDGAEESAFTAGNLAAPSISGEDGVSVPAFGENIGNIDAANASETDVAAFKAKAEAKLPAYEKEAWRYGNSADFSRLRTADTSDAEHMYLIEEGMKKAYAFRRKAFDQLLNVGMLAADPWQGFTTDGVLDVDKLPQVTAENAYVLLARVFPSATDSTVLQENFGTTDRAEIGRRVLKGISRAAESDFAVRRRWVATEDMDAVRDELRQLGVLAGIPEEMQTNPLDVEEAVQTRRYYVNKMGGINELVLSSVESVEEFGEAFALSMMTEDKRKKVIADVLSRDPAKAGRLIQAASAYAAYADAGFFASTLRSAKSVIEGGVKGLSNVWNATKDAFSSMKKNAEDDAAYAMNDAWINDEGGSAMLTAGDIDSMSDEDVLRLAGDAVKKKTYSNQEWAKIYMARRTGKPSGVSSEYSAGEIREMYKRGSARWIEAFSGVKAKELGAPQFHPENWIAETSYDLGYSAGYMVPGVLGGAAAGFLTLNPYVPVAVMAGYWGMSGYGEQMEAWLSSGDVTTGRAERRLSSAIYGGIQAVTGTIGSGAVAAGGRAMLGGAAGRLASTSFGRGVSTFMNRGALRFAKHAVNDDTALFLLRYGNGSVARKAAAYLARTAGSATVTTVVEGGTEVIEEVAMAAARDAVSDERSKTFSGGDAGVDWEAVTDSLAEVFKLGSITGLVLSGVMRAPATVSEARSMLRKREELDGKNIFTATQERLAVLVAARQADFERARKGVKASPDGEGAAALPDAEVIRMVMNAEGEEERAAAYANERFAALSDKDKAFVRTLAEVYDMSDSKGKAQIQSIVSDAGVLRAGKEYFTTEELRKAGELIGMELRRGDIERGIREDEAMLEGMKKELVVRQYENAESEADIKPRASREYGFLTDAELGQNIRVGERVVSGNKEELAKLKNKIENFTIFTAGTAERTRAATKSAHAAYITGDTEEARERRNILREMRREGTSTEFFDEVGEIIGIDWDAEEDSPRVRARKAAEEAAEAARKAAEDARKAAEEAERRMAELRAERRRKANEMKRGAQRAGVEIAEEIVRLLKADEDARAEAEYLGTEAANRIIEMVRDAERERNAEQLRSDREQYRETAEEEARRRAWEEEQLVSRNEELARINAQIAAQRAIAQAKRLASDEAERKLRASLETPNAVPLQTDKRGEEILKIVKSGGDAAEEIMARGWASNRAEAWMLVSMALIGNSDRIRNAIIKARDSKFTEAILENGWKANEAGLLEDFEDAVVWYAENKERMSELVARMAKGNIFFKAFVNDFASRDYQAMSRFFSYYVYLVRARVYREGIGEGSRFAHPIVNLTNQMIGVVSYAASRAGVSNDFDADVQYKLMDVNAERAYPTEEEVRIILNDALERSKDIIEPYVEGYEPMSVDVSDDVRRELGLAGASFPAERGINTGLTDEISRLGIDAADYASTEASGGDVEAQDAANEAASQGVSADEAAAYVAAEAASQGVSADEAAEATTTTPTAEDAATKTSTAAKSSNKKRAKSIAAAQEVAGIAVRDNAERQISETKRMEKTFSEKKRSTRIPFVPTVVVDGVTENTVRAKMPYKITGNKASIIGRHSGVFAALGKLAQAQGGRVVDAFFGAGVYTYFLDSQNALPKGSVINEYDRSRYIANRNIRDDAAGVKRALTDILRRWESSAECAAFKRNIETYNSRVKNRKRGETVNFLDAYSENTILKWINDELGGKHGVSYAEGGKLTDSAHTAAMYLFLQSRAARGRVVSLDYDAKSGRAVARYGDKGNASGGDVSQGFARIDNATKLGKYASPSMSLNESGALNAAAEKVIDEASRTLSGKEIINGDGWKVAMPEDMGGVARKGDVVFVDPPYWYTMGYSKGNKGAAHNDAERQLDALRKMAEEGAKRGITYVFTNEYGFYGYGSSSEGRDVNLDESVVPALEAIPNSRVNKAVRRGAGAVSMDVVFVSGTGRFLLAPSKKELDASGEKNAGKAYAKLNETMEGELPDAVKPLMRDWNRAATKNVLFQKATEVFTGTRDARLQDKLRRFSAWLERAGVTVSVVSDEDFDNRLRELTPESSPRYSRETLKHGSPHMFAAEEGAPFGRFRDDKMGTGEGVQAFGWGHYLTNRKGVAKRYANMPFVHQNLPPEQRDLKGLFYNSYVPPFILKTGRHMLPGGKGENEAREELKKFAFGDEAPLFLGDGVKPDDVAGILDNPRQRAQLMLSMAKQELANVEINLSAYELPGITKNATYKNLIKNRRELRAFIAGIPKEYLPRKERNLYTTKIDTGEQDANLLDWIRPMTLEQEDRLFAQAERELSEGDMLNFKEAFIDGRLTAEEVHESRDLERIFGSPKGISKFLHRAGFIGHKFPAQSRGRGDYSDGTNYVIYSGEDIEITGAVRWLRDVEVVVYGYYDASTKEVVIREGARADTLVHELGWHATYDWAAANAPELYEQMRRYAQNAPDEIKEAVASAYGYAEGVIDEEAFIDEAGAAFFSKEHSKAIEDAIDGIEDSSLRGRARRWWHAFRELLFKAWTKLVGTYSRYYTEDGKRKVDLKGILEAANTAQEAVAGIADAFAKGQILADYADAYKRQNPQETTRGDVLGWAARNRGDALADAVLSGVRFQRGFTDAAKVIEDNRAEAEKAATRILSSNRQHQQWADILLGGWQDFVESGTSRGGLIEARRFDVLNAKIMSERHKALAESDSAKIAQARVEHSAKRAPSREAARIVAEYDIPLFDGTKGWARRVYEIISEREPDKEHARSLASVVWAEQFSRVSNDILSASKSVDVHDIIDRILSGKSSLDRQLRRAEKIEDILIDKNEAQLVAAKRESMRNLLESHEGQFKPQKRTEDRTYYGGTELFLRNVARYGLARNGERWQEYFELEAEKARGELTSASEPVRLEAMGKLRALDLWWGKSFTEMDAAELVAMECYIADVASEGKAIREQALAAKKESAERAWRDVASAAGESAAKKGGDPNRESSVRNFLAFGQSVRSKLESAVRFASEEKYKKAVEAVREIDLRITEANNVAAGMLTDAEHAFMSALLKLAGQEDKITPKKSGASYVRMSRAAEKILFDMILTRPEGSERFSARGEKLTWAELTAQYLMMSQTEWADMYSNVDAETASNPEWRAKNPAYERFVKLGELESFLGEKRVEFAHAASDILQSFDTRIDAQSIKDTGVSLSYKRGRGYFPIVHSMKNYMANLTPSIAGGTPALVPKILIPRQHSRIDIDEHADVFSLFRRQAYDITHYIAHGEAGTSSDIRALLSSDDYAAFREDIAKVGGASAANALWAHLNQVLAGRLEGAEFYSNLDGGINKAFAVLRWLTRAVGLGFNIVSGLKSALGGIPSYINHYGFGATLYAMVRAIPNGNVVFTEDFKEILDSDGYKQRYGNNAMNRVLVAARMPKVIPPKLAMRLMRTETNMMMFTSYADRIPIFLVGSSIYSAMKNHYVAEGKTVEEAKRLAMRDFWQVQDATQQARQIQNMDSLTRSGSSVLKVFAQFQTSPMQFISDQIHAVETFAARKDLESFKRLLTITIHNHILQPGAMFLATIIAEAIFGSARDEDDSLFNDEDAAAFLIGSMSAIPFIGGAIEWAVMKAVADDNPYYTANMFAPSASETGSKIAQRTTNLIEKIVDGEEGEAKEAAIKLAESVAAVRYFNRAYDKYVAEEDGE